MGNRRNSRIGSLIRAELGQLLVQEAADPGLRSVCVTEVVVAQDLKTAKVFFQIVGGDDKGVEAGLKRAAPFFRRRLSQNLEMRSIPELVFELDTHTDNLNRLLGLLEEVKGRAG